MFVRFAFLILNMDYQSKFEILLLVSIQMMLFQRVMSIESTLQRNMIEGYVSFEFYFIVEKTIYD